MARTKSVQSLFQVSFFFCSWRTAPSWPGPPQYGCFTITFRHNALARTPLGEWSALLMSLLPDNTQHSQQTDIHATGRIRTRNPSKRAAAEPHLRPLGHWNRLVKFCYSLKLAAYSFHNVVEGWGIKLKWEWLELGALWQMRLLSVTAKLYSSVINCNIPYCGLLYLLIQYVQEWTRNGKTTMLCDIGSPHNI